MSLGKGRRDRTASADDDRAEEIGRLVALREAGTISLAEFDRRKAALLVVPERPETADHGNGVLLPMLILGVIVVLAAIVVLSAGR